MNIRGMALCVWLCCCAEIVCTAVLSAQTRTPDSTRTDSLARVTLPAVTVSVARRVTELGRVPYAVALLDGNELRRGRATDGLDEALVTIAGVFIANRYNPALDQRLSIRGFGARAAFGVRGVKVLLDGIPQTLPDGQGQLTNIELGDVAQVEVLRGSSSALYGNASGGVISFTTTDPGIGIRQGGARMTAGHFGFRKLMIDGTAPLGTGGITIIASRTTADGYRTHSKRERRNVGMRLSQSLSARTQLKVHAYLTEDPLAENPGALTREQADTMPEQADPRNLAVEARKIVTQFQAGASLHHDLAGGGKIDVAGFLLRRDLDNPLAFATIDLNRWAVGTRAQITVPFRSLPGAPEITVGVDAQWQRDDRTNTSPDGSAVTLEQLEHVSEVGPFVQGVVSIGALTTLTVGGRYDRVAYRVEDRLTGNGDQSGERVMDALSGTAGVAVVVSDALAPYASVSTSFETPTTTELVNRPQGGGGLNPKLEPQTATNVEIGVRGTLHGLVTYSATLFRAVVRDELIPFEVASEPGRRFFRNAGESRHRGAEISLDVRLPAGFALVGAYTLADYEFTEFKTAVDTLDGNTIPGVPRHRTHVSLRWEGTRGWWVAIDHNYSSSVVVDDRNTTRADAWMTTGLRAGWSGRVGRATVTPFVSVLNLFGARYDGSVVVNARGGRYYEPAPGRNIVIGLEVRAGR